MNIRNDWSLAEVEELFALPFMDLLFRAQQVHRQYQIPNTVQISTLLSIKTGACPEDCAYCPQSVRYDTGLETEDLMELEAVTARAHAAKKAGATRFCMGAAYRSPKPKDLRKVVAMIREVKSLGLETCATLGMVSLPQARELKAAGLDYYNHNLDTSPEYYEKIITTRTFQERLDTLQAVRDAGMNVCCGGIVGMGEAAAGPRRAAAYARHAAKPPRQCSGQSAGARRRYAAWRMPSPWILSISSAPSPSPASSCRAPTCACRRGAAT